MDSEKWMVDGWERQGMALRAVDSGWLGKTGNGHLSDFSNAYAKRRFFEEK